MTVPANPRGPGRPRTDHARLTARVAAAREVDPSISVRALARLLRVGREPVRLALERLADARGWAENPHNGISSTREDRL